MQTGGEVGASSALGKIELEKKSNNLFKKC
jgi:hypothetical protein